MRQPTDSGPSVPPEVDSHYAAGAGAGRVPPNLETPEYAGRAVVALATDANVIARSGRVLTVGELAAEYGFTDVDGRQLPPLRVEP